MSPSAAFVPADLRSLGLDEIAALAAAPRPPVDRWDPPHCGQSGMRIRRDGTWFHEGSPIRREGLVRLFSSVLRREEDGGFVLVTPAEKLAIDVEDAPFVAVEMRTESEGRDRTIALRLNSGDLVVAGPGNALRVENRGGEPRPLLSVRAGLDALLARPVYYELAELALAEGAEPPGLWSGGAFFALGPAP